MKRKFRTDLATELREEYMKEYSVEHKGEPDGIVFKEKNAQGIKISNIEIVNENGEKVLGKPVGSYFTVDVGRIWQSDYEKFKRSADEIAKILNILSEDESSVFVVGLGNRYITADAVGPLAANNVIITRHIKEHEKSLYDSVGFGDISALVPGVLSQTGIEASELIKGAIELMKPSLIIVVDALAAKSIDTLATTVQITNAGISPGSGVGNDRGELSKKTLGVDTIAIGVPTVVDTTTLVWNVLEEYTNDAENIFDRAKTNMKNCFVCPKDADVAVEEMAKLIGYAINKAYHRIITYDEMMFL